MGLGRASSIVIRVVFIMFSIDSVKEAPAPNFGVFRIMLPQNWGLGGLRVSSLLHRSPNWRSGGLCDRYVKAAIETFAATA